MGRKPSLVAQKASYDECWLKEWFLKLIRAASGLTCLGWSPQLNTACGRRARVFPVRSYPVLWFEGKESIFLHFYAHLPHTLPCQTAESTASLPSDYDLHCPPRVSSLFHFPALDHYFKLISLIVIFLVWNVRNIHHGTRKHIYSDFKVVNFSLPSMRITSVLRLWKIKYFFHKNLKCRNRHNFLQK